ncbi:MAG: hypothetical protein ABLT11_02215 [Candidatus Acidiferrum sp.]
MLALHKAPTGIIAVGIFLFFGATMACLAGVTLTWPGTILDRIWRLNEPAYARLAPLGKTAGILFLLLSAALALAGAGWFKRRRWGWLLAVAIIATQVLGDLVNAFTGDVLRGAIGFIIAGALLIYLLQPKIRLHFETGKDVSARQ